MHDSLDIASPARYFPFETGKYSIAPGLHKLGQKFGNGEADRKVFQLDENWPWYRSNKEACRKENYEKYACTHNAKADSLWVVSDFIVSRLLEEYPAFFELTRKDEVNIFQNRMRGEQIRYTDDGHLLAPSHYRNLPDALAMQIQEDLAIWKLEGDQDWMSYIHLCAPNHWAPAAKIGRPFSAVHLPVAGMEAMRARYQPMLRSLLKGGSYVRFAWGLSTDNRLNHHPEAPKGHDLQAWKGRAFDPADPQLFVRTERQTLTGFPEVQAVLFTIRTYFEDVQSLTQAKRNQLHDAIESMSHDTLRYKGLHADKENLLNFLA